MNSLIKKGVVVSVILLFVSVSVIPSTGTTVVNKSTIPTFYDGNTLYVGGSGPDNYSKIQDAIDNASNGDTVFVYDDSSPYYENVIVNKSINLVGENRETTIIDGKIYVSVDWVNISEFTIQCGIDLDSCGNNTISSNNIICNRSYWNGIGLSYSCNNIITDNKILDSIHGIDMFHSSNNNITGNYISSRTIGIDLHSSNNNNITGNKIFNFIGIILYQSINNIITGNNIISNALGIYLVFSIKNIIEKNNFIGNRRHASFSLVRNFRIGNQWDSNYWHNWIGNWGGIGPKIIFGRLGLYGMIPWVNFDRNPAREPYDI